AHHHGLHGGEEGRNDRSVGDLAHKFPGDSGRVGDQDGVHRPRRKFPYDENNRQRDEGDELVAGEYSFHGYLACLIRMKPGLSDVSAGRRSPSASATARSATLRIRGGRGSWRSPSAAWADRRRIPGRFAPAWGT